jgi:hypothetical protein
MNTFNRLSGQGDVLAHIEDSFRSGEIQIMLSREYLQAYAMQNTLSGSFGSKYAWKQIETLLSDESNPIEWIAEQVSAYAEHETYERTLNELASAKRVNTATIKAYNEFLEMLQDEEERNASA